MKINFTSREKTIVYLISSFVFAQFCLSYSFVPCFVTVFAWVHFVTACIYLINK